MSEAADIPPFWCELQPNRLVLATVTADGTVRHVDMNLEAFPSDPDEAQEWMHAVKNNLHVAVDCLFGAQLRDAWEKRNAGLLDRLGKCSPV